MARRIARLVWAATPQDALAYVADKKDSLAQTIPDAVRVVDLDNAVLVHELTKLIDRFHDGVMREMVLWPALLDKRNTSTLIRIEWVGDVDEFTVTTLNGVSLDLIQLTKRELVKDRVPFRVHDRYLRMGWNELDLFIRKKWEGRKDRARYGDSYHYMGEMYRRLFRRLIREKRLVGIGYRTSSGHSRHGQFALGTLARPGSDRVNVVTRRGNDSSEVRYHDLDRIYDEAVPANWHYKEAYLDYHIERLLQGG